MNSIGKQVTFYRNDDEPSADVFNRVPIQYHDKMQRLGGFYDKLKSYNAGETVKVLILDKQLNFPTTSKYLEEGDVQILSFISLVNNNNDAPIEGLGEDRIYSSNVPYYYGEGFKTNKNWVMVLQTRKSIFGNKISTKFSIPNAPISNDDQDIRLIKLIDESALEHDGDLIGSFRVTLTRGRPNIVDKKVMMSFDVDVKHQCKSGSSIPMIRIRNVNDSTEVNATINESNIFGTSSKFYSKVALNGFVLSLIPLKNVACGNIIALAVVSDNSGIEQNVEVTIQDLGAKIIKHAPEMIEINTILPYFTGHEDVLLLPIIEGANTQFKGVGEIVTRLPLNNTDKVYHNFSNGYYPINKLSEDIKDTSFTWAIRSAKLFNPSDIEEVLKTSTSNTFVKIF